MFKYIELPFCFIGFDLDFSYWALGCSFRTGRFEEYHQQDGTIEVEWETWRLSLCFGPLELFVDGL